MPALRVYCYDVCGKNCDRKGYTRSLLRWIADDDLRGIAKYSIVFRGMQLLILIPTFVVLVKTYINTKKLLSTTSSGYPQAIPCGMRKLSIIVWFFWSTSLFTIVFSIVLDIFM